ncbi:MAG TPA: S8 family serine peptidase [Gaiellaceae bacterium]|nr:S8 family serine peptidase [Gaiellaceae bacterium]
MRRLVLVSGTIALLTATTASAALQPLRRDAREAASPRVRVGKIVVPAGHAKASTRVVVQLSAPPLAAWNAERRLAGASAVRHLNVHTASARAYLATLARKQAAAVAELHAAIPQAQVQERYSVLLDGFAVQLPNSKLPKLERLGFVSKVFPTLTYLTADDTSTQVIQAATFSHATGDAGEGIKIGVVDTGVDSTNPFLSPAGFAYPAGFPKGDTSLTTPKVIVARNFPAPGATGESKKAFDPEEPHGTHVAGIAAGDAGTTAPAGPDHPQTANLTGVAPRAWIGSYRVFNVPTPLGDEGDTPEIIAAFESAVADGMNVINFSGGGPEVDPAQDAMIETVRNTVLAGVVPVIAAGNDRDNYGLGTVGSPGTAPDAITVAAVSNSHVFAPALSVSGGPAALSRVPIQPAAGTKLPGAWSTLDQTVVDAASLVGSDGKPVDPYLCGPASDPNGAGNALPAGSLTGKIVLVNRGLCAFVAKAARAHAAGAVGMILIDNRPGEANATPLALEIPSGTISDLDGAALRTYLAQHGGSAAIRVSAGIQEIPTDRAGVMTSFSSAGPTDFDAALKPDVSAPGLDILSSTPPATTGSTFSVFAGTSMATPHIAGAAALLVQHHPDWTVAAVKSALMNTAGPAWGNTARTQEAPVLLEGAGLADLTQADDPHVFAAPQSLSFGRVDVTHGAQRLSQLVTLTDAGNGSGTWTATMAPQAQSAGVQIDVPGFALLAPGGDVTLPVTVRVAADATTGNDFGFIDLTNGSVTRRIPYAFTVERPVLANAPVTALARLQTGTTKTGTNRASVYCCPSEPFGPPADYTGSPMNESGAEHLYSIDIEQPVANFGVSILAESSGALVDPWVLGSKDENDVQGYAGTPVNVNSLMFDGNLDIGVAGTQFPVLKRYYIAVDSRSDPFTNRPLPGQYVLNAWENDVTPPAVRFITTKVSAGRPLIVAQAVDDQSGVDPLSIALGYSNRLVAPSAYDPTSGLVLIGLPPAAPALKPGTVAADLQVSDNQESKNINTFGSDVMPNTAFAAAKLKVVNGPAATWILPGASSCVPRSARLVATASSTAKVTKVVFRDGDKQIASVRPTTSGLYAATWKTTKADKGKHRLTVEVVDKAGRTATAARTVRVCG